MTKLSKVSFFLFSSIYSYLWLRIIVFHFFYNSYGNMGIYYILIFAAIILFLLFLIPKKIINFDYEEVFKKSYFKYFYYTILILECVFGITFSVYILSALFVKQSFIIMLFFIAFLISFLSKLKTSDVMQIATLFCIVGYGILTLTLFFYPDLDFSVLYPRKLPSFIGIPFFIFMFLADNFTLLINKKEIQFSRLNYILALFLGVVLFGIEYFILIANAGDVLFKNFEWVGFISLSIEPITQYIGDFDFAYIFYIMICCIFKYTYNFSLIRNSTEISPNIMSGIIFLTIFVLGIISFKFIPMGQAIMLIVSILLLLSFCIFFWFIKECYYVRKTKE